MKDLADQVMKFEFDFYERDRQPLSKMFELRESGIIIKNNISSKMKELQKKKSLYINEFISIQTDIMIMERHYNKLHKFLATLDAELVYEENTCYNSIENFFTANKYIGYYMHVSEAHDSLIELCRHTYRTMKLSSEGFHMMFSRGPIQYGIKEFTQSSIDTMCAKLKEWIHILETQN